MHPIKNILVIRFSALGDVAMTVPVIKNVLDQNPHINITMVSDAFMQPLFENIPRCHFFPAFIKGSHKGFTGIIKLFREINNAQSFNSIIDLHDVLRSKLLRTLFLSKGVQYKAIDKGRKEKKELTRKNHKIVRQLKTTHHRYADVFNRAGIPVTLDTSTVVLPKRILPASFTSYVNEEKELIGIAPFAKHKEKMYPLERMKLIAEELAQYKNIGLIFLGSPAEAAVLKEWEKSIPGSLCIAGKFSFREELDIISNLKAVVSMDSANVHLASLFKTPVVSIWGATHPFAGFTGWAQSYNQIAQIDLYCRPCSVFGNKPCYRGDHACMNEMPVAMILEKIKSTLTL